MPRFQITSLIVLVALIAGGLGAMRYVSEMLAKSFTTLLVVAMLVGLAGALILRKAAWIGFAVFLMGYAGPFPFVPGGADFGELAIRFIADRLHPNKIPRPAPPRFSSPYVDDMGSSESYTSASVKSEIEAINDRGFLRERLTNDTQAYSDEQFQTLQDYQTALGKYREQVKRSAPRINNAITIGNACLALALGWVGASVGRTLDKRRLASPPSRPIDLESTTTP